MPMILNLQNTIRSLTMTVMVHWATILIPGLLLISLTSFSSVHADKNSFRYIRNYGNIERDPVLRFQPHKIDPDASRNVSQLITSKGYPCEAYEVQTEDGYILAVQRIPHGVHTQGNKGVVLLQHGFLASAVDWVVNPANESLGFILADAGYDVWMANSRGSTYSRKHVKFSPDQDEFWAWSWDELAKYDTPAIINYVLRHTGQNQLYYIGHSQGTLQGFSIFSENSTLASKVKLFVALGPVATIKYMTTPLRDLKNIPDSIMFAILGRKDILTNNWLVKILGSTMCKAKITSPICTNIVFLISGYDLANLNVSRLPVYVAHSPAGSSVQNFVHYAQMARSGLCQAYDYQSEKENMAHYHQPSPPVCDFTKMKTPTVLFYAENDALADPKDVKELEKKISNLKGSYELKGWNHLDFVWGLNAADMVYNRVLKLMKEY